MTTRAFEVQGLDHVVLRCVRLEDTMRFYIDVLGLTLEREVPAIGLYQLRAGASLIDLVPIGSELGGEQAPHEPTFNLAHFCLRIDRADWDAIGATLAAHGIGHAQPARRYGADGYGESVYIRDPEGNTVELKGPPV